MGGGGFGGVGAAGGHVGPRGREEEWLRKEGVEMQEAKPRLGGRGEKRMGGGESPEKKVATKSQSCVEGNQRHEEKLAELVDGGKTGV